MDECLEHLKRVDGVMLGREVYENPYRLAEVDARLFGDATPPPTRAEALIAMRPYIERELAEGTGLMHITRHILGLYRNQPGGKQFRRILSERAHQEDADWSTIEDALHEVERNASSKPAQQAA
jgi:tRNA-dihydrouridine synthase A